MRAIRSAVQSKPSEKTIHALGIKLSPGAIREAQREAAEANNIFNKANNLAANNKPGSASVVGGSSADKLVQNANSGKISLAEAIRLEEKAVAQHNKTLGQLEENKLQSQSKFAAVNKAISTANNIPQAPKAVPKQFNPAKMVSSTKTSSESQPAPSTRGRGKDQHKSTAMNV